MLSANQNKLPDHVILEISKRLSIRDVIHLSSTNKHLRSVLLNKQGLQFYCYHNAIPLLLPISSDSNNLISFLEGHYYYLEAQKLYSQIEEVEKKVLAKIGNSKHTSLFTATKFSDLSPFEQSLYQGMDFSEAFSLNFEKKSLLTKYNELLTKATEKLNLLAILQNINLEQALIYNHQPLAAEEGLNSGVKQLSNLKSTYGDIIHLLISKIGLSYADFLLKGYKEVRNGLESEDYYIEDNLTTEGVLSLFERKIQQFLELAEESINKQKNVKLDYYNTMVVIKIIDPSCNNLIDANNFLQNQLNKIQFDCLRQTEPRRLGSVSLMQ